MSKEKHLARGATELSSLGESRSEGRSAEETLADHVTHDDPSSTVVGSLESLSSAPRPLVKKSLDLKDKRLGSYEIQELLGKGGIGLVYLAYDHKLTRRVALKLLRTDDPDAAHRLLDEARSQARVEHENVCQVYEAGEIDGQTYIAMQYIEGRPLTEAFREMTLEEQVRVIQRVAEGLDAAHRHNLIHRDVKPGNVLVERTPRGEWKPYILDFGLAREQAAPGETTTGEVKGTPSYMPPEQVTGQIHSLDARTDIYSLGATFYEGISGRQLFPESSGGLAVMLKVLNDDPEPVRVIDRSIPVDIESIIMRCLEKDPSRRYASAQDLATDLQRFLDGEPVTARSIGPLIRLWRRLKKKRVAVLTAGLVTTVLVSAALLTYSQLHARAKTELMEEYRQDVQFIDQLIGDAYRAPLHDISEEKTKVRDRLTEIHSRLETAGRLAKGPGHYALGRGHLALSEYEKAHEHLQIAWENGARDAEVSYAMGRALGALYEKELLVARRIPDEAQREDRLREIERLYREPALDFLRQSRDAKVDSVEMVEALMALWERRYDEALAKAEIAHSQVPWLYEAQALQGDIHVASGLERYNRGLYEEAMAAFRSAQAAYAKASEKGRSDTRIFEGQCNLSFAMMTLEFYGLRNNPQTFFEYGLEACEKARKVDPERAGPYELESMLNWRMGDYEKSRGIDPTDHLTKAAEAAMRALEIAPDHVETHASLGWAYSLLSEWKSGQGQDPRPTASRALEAFEAGVKLDAQIARFHNGLGYTRNLLAEWELHHGEDASLNLSLALEALERAVALDPIYNFAFDNLGNTYLTRALWELSHGEDPHSSVEEAVRSFTRLEELNPNYIWAHNGIGDAWTNLAEHQLTHDEDPTESFLKARAAYEKALLINSEEGWISLSLGRLATLEGRWEASMGGDPATRFRRARNDLEEGISRIPGEAWGYRRMAELSVYWARWNLDHGRSPTSEIDRGLAAVDQAREIEPAFAEVLALEGHLLLLRGQAENGPLRRRVLEKAGSAFQRALENNVNLSYRFKPLLEKTRALF